VTRSKGRGSANKDSSASDRSSAEPSDKQLNEKGKFQLVIGGVKKEPPRKVTADEAAAIVMAATRGLGSMNPQSNTRKDTRDIGHIQDPGEVSKPVSSSEVCTSLTSSGQVKKEGIGIIDDDWISNTIAKAVAVASSKEADSSEASMTNAQKLKAERLRRARMFTAIIKGGGSKGDPVTSDPVDESAKVSPADLNLPGPDDTKALATEREGSSVPSECEDSNMKKQEKDSDDEQNKARKYRKHRPESNEDIDDLEEESYKHSRKRHRSRGHSMDAHKHKQRQHSKDREYMHQRHSYSSSEDERRSSKSRHRHRHDHYYAEDDEHRSLHKHRRNHGSGSKRKHKDDHDPIEQSLGRAEPSQSTSEQKQPPGDTAQSSNASTEVPDELKAKIRAMLLETM
jgi:hypothetical protein